MTEVEWMISTDPAAMLHSLNCRHAVQKRRGETPNYEQLRMFACACCRRATDLLGEDHRKSIEMIEEFVRSPTPIGLRAARRVRWAASNQTSNDHGRCSRAVPRDRRLCLISWARNLASSAVWQAAERNPVKAANCHREVAEAVHSLYLADGGTCDGPDPGYIGYQLPAGGELVTQADLLREIVGDPFARKLLASG